MRPSTLLASAFLLFAAQRASATPFYYTFDGSLFYAQGTSGYVVGQAVHYVVLVDQAQDGYIDYGGFANPYSPIGTPGIDATWLDPFYARYIGGDAIANDGAGMPGNRQSHYYGYDYDINGFHIGSLSVSNADPAGYDYLEFLAAGRLVSEWTVGLSGIIGTNIMQDAAGANLTLQSSLTLTGISEVNPLEGAPEAVPEPTTLALFGFGLIGLALAGRKFRI
jgi:hypothetical protein